MANTSPWPSSGAVGIGTTSPFAPLTVTPSGNPEQISVAAANASGTAYVQLQAGTAHLLTKTVVVGATDTNDLFDSRKFGTVGFIQAEYEGYYYSPLYLNPIGGKVHIGTLAPPGPIDVDPSGSAYLPPVGTNNGIRFLVQQTVTTGNAVMASFEFESTDVSNADQGSGRFVAGQTSGTGNAKFRALEAHARKQPGALSNVTWGIEVGVHSDVAGNKTNRNVGVYISSHYSGWVNPPGVRNDSGILIEGHNGWYNGILYRDTDGSTVLFSVDQDGNISSNGFGQPIIVIFAAYTAGVRDTYLMADATSGAFTVTLPPASSTVTGRMYAVKRINSGANNVTVQTSAGDSIDSGNSVVLSTQYSVLRAISGGSGSTQWWIV